MYSRRSWRRFLGVSISCPGSLLLLHWEGRRRLLFGKLCLYLLLPLPATSVPFLPGDKSLSSHSGCPAIESFLFIRVLDLPLTCLYYRATVYTNFDAKYNYIVALFLFEVGSALCGAANIMDALIFGRVIAGLGGSGLYLGVLTILSSVTTPQERPLYVASSGLTWGFGSVLGPVIGGSFADSSATWRWSFYINLVVAALFAPVYLFMVPSVNPKPGKSKLERLAGLDYVGSFLIIAGSACGVTGLSFGGSVFAWNTGTIIALLCVSIVLLVLFGIQQGFCLFTTFDRRLLPVQYFKSRTLILMFITSAVAGGPIFIPTYFIPLFFQFSKGDGALGAAVRILPFMFLLVCFSLLNGAAMGKEGHYKAWYIFATVMILIGSALMFTVDEHTSTGRIYGYSVVLGIGAGTIVQTGFIVAQAVVPRSEMSSGNGFPPSSFFNLIPDFTSNRLHQPCADRRHGHRIDVSKHHLPQRRSTTDWRRPSWYKP